MTAVGMRHLCQAGLDVPDRDAVLALVRRWPSALSEVIAQTGELLHHDSYNLPARLQHANRSSALRNAVMKAALPLAPR